MGKLFILYITLQLFFNINFTDGVDFEDYKEKILQKRSTNETTPTIVPNLTTISGMNITTTAKVDKSTVLSTRTVEVRSTQQPNLESNQTKVINNIVSNLTAKYPEASKNINTTLKNLGIQDPTTLLMKLNNSTLDKVKSSINQTNLQKEINKTQDLVKTEVSRRVLQHQAETTLKDIEKSMVNTSLSGLTNRTTNIIRKNWNYTSGLPKINLTMLLDPEYNPNLWLMRLQAPWTHVSGSNTANETEVEQVCKFDTKIAVCSAQYTSWRTKAWFEFAESPERNGINITVYERGHTPRVSFYNKVNGTECQRFDNGSLHQICVKIYGYEKDLGPTRVCLQLGAAIFNHGVASTDFGCFRFGSAVRHENPLEQESPNEAILNRFILSNNYTNINNRTANGSFQIRANLMWLFLVVAIAIFVQKE